MASIIRTISQRRIPTPKETTPRTNSTKAPDLPFHFCGDFVISRRAVSAKINDTNPRSEDSNNNKISATAMPAAAPENKTINKRIDPINSPRETKM